jgi:hypothetical protein
LNVEPCASAAQEKPVPRARDLSQQPLHLTQPGDIPRGLGSRADWAGLIFGPFQVIHGFAIALFGRERRDLLLSRLDLGNRQRVAVQRIRYRERIVT